MVLLTVFWITSWNFYLKNLWIFSIENHCHFDYLVSENGSYCHTGFNEQSEKRDTIKFKFFWTFFCWSWLDFICLMWIYFLFYVLNAWFILLIDAMEKTWRDLKKLSSTSMTYTKKAVYYGFIPLIVILGLRTVNMENFTGQAPMWFDIILCLLILMFVVLIYWLSRG